MSAPGSNRRRRQRPSYSLQFFKNIPPHPKNRPYAGSLSVVKPQKRAIKKIFTLCKSATYVQKTFLGCNTCYTSGLVGSAEAKFFTIRPKSNSCYSGSYILGGFCSHFRIRVTSVTLPSIAKLRLASRRLLAVPLDQQLTFFQSEKSL